MIKDIKKKQLFCSNCGKIGHIYKRCKEPITSVGIIDIKINTDEVTLPKEEQINIINYNNNNISILLKNIDKYKDKIKFLFIRRKQSLAYIEFVKGRYDENDCEDICNLFKLMSPEEINFIKENDYKTLWSSLWKTNIHFDEEFESVKNKCEYIKNNGFYHIAINTKPLYLEPEWGFPKGKRNKKEKDIDCAVREFHEETGLSSNDYKLLYNIDPINEKFNGTNGVPYKHIYYVGIDNSNKDLSINQDNYHQSNEIGDIKWLTYDEAVNKIRPYNEEKKKILNNIFIFMSTLFNN